MRFQFISPLMMMFLSIIFFPLWLIISFLFFGLLLENILPFIPLHFWLKVPMSICFAFCLGHIAMMEIVIFPKRVRGEASYAEHRSEMKNYLWELGYLLLGCAVTIAFYLVMRPYALNLDLLQTYVMLFASGYIVLSLYLLIFWAHRWKKPQPKQL